jgi:hypothetical protein
MGPIIFIAGTLFGVLATLNIMLLVRDYKSKPETPEQRVDKERAAFHQWLLQKRYILPIQLSGELVEKFRLRYGTTAYKLAQAEGYKLNEHSWDDLLFIDHSKV